MNMQKSDRVLLSLCFILGAMGFLIPFWPLEALAVILASLGGHPFFAVGFGLLLDVAYGAPVGHFEFLYFPFTLLGGLGFLARLFGGRFFLQKSPQEKL